MHMLILTLAMMSAGSDATSGPIASHQRLHAVPFTAVRVNDTFWAPRIRRNRERTLPHNVKECEATGRIANFAKAAGLEPGTFEGIYFNDSDVYKMLEGIDNGGKVRDVALPPDAILTAQFEPDLLGGVTVLRGRGLAAQPGQWHDRLYSSASVAKPADITAVPYYAWDNRAPGEMVVWIPESTALAETQTLAVKAKTTASHVWNLDSAGAANDGAEPKNSDDHTIPRFTWWPRKGSTEWLAYEFDKPRRIKAAEVYWFDDRPRGGGGRVPRSWRLLYKNGDDWKPVTGASTYGVARDQFNRVAFDPVETTALKLEAELRDGFSAGVLEWRLP